jgi:hypothetical protein
VQLADVLQRLTGERHPTDLDDVQRLRTEKLILFRGPQITIANAERLQDIVLIRDSLSAKWTIPELAFFMVLHGLDGVPPGLVAEYIEKQTQGFLSASKRTLDRLGSDRVGRKRRDLPIEEGMARLLTRQILRSIALPQRTAATETFRAFLENALTVLIGGAYRNKPVAEVMPYLRRAAFLIADASSADSLVQYLASRLDDWLSIVRVDWAANQLLTDVRYVAQTNPDAIRLAVRDSARMLRLCFRMLGEVPDPEPPRMTPTNQYMLGRLIGPLPAVFAAMSLRASRDPRSRNFLSQLRSGDNFGLTPSKIANIHAHGIAQLRALQQGIEPVSTMPPPEIWLPAR